MKKLIFTVTILFSFLISSAQQLPAWDKKPGYEFYLNKSKQQKKIALFTGISGGLVFLTGLVLETGYIISGVVETNHPEKGIRMSHRIMWAGAGLSVTGIGFGIASTVNKNKAARLMVNTSYLSPSPTVVFKERITSIGFSIPL